MQALLRDRIEELLAKSPFEKCRNRIVHAAHVPYTALKWKAGYNDAVRTLRHPEVLQRPDGPDGVFTFDLATQDRAVAG